jgi:leucyl-tRNA synthetase
MELTSTLRKAVDRGPGAADPAVRAGAEALATTLSLFAPYTAEECWANLGHDVESGDTVSRSRWPQADPELLVEETTVCVVQVDGKVRARLEVPTSIGEDELRSRALAAVAHALAEREPVKVIVRAPTLVNVVLPSL